MSLIVLCALEISTEILASFLDLILSVAEFGNILVLEGDPLADQIPDVPEFSEAIGRCIPLNELGLCGNTSRRHDSTK